MLAASARLAELVELFADSGYSAVAVAAEGFYRLSIGTLMMILETRQGKVPSVMVLGRLQTFLQASVINTELNFLKFFGFYSSGYM